ncbi:MAG TPA: protein translocase subunit SecF [Terriglobales bacterium]|nr:protein translocase subunit SecF [Terriglobales bacterium]
MEFFKTPHINFMKYRFWALGFTGAVILAGALNIFFGKGLKLGVDFGGGTLIRIVFKSPTTVSEIRSELNRVGLGESVIQESGQPGREFMIRTLQVVSAKDAQQEIEAHERLGNRVVEALRGEDGQAEAARGLKDLNAIDLASLTTLLQPAFRDKAEELAKEVIHYRTTKTTGSGIIEDYAGLAQAGIGPDVIKELQAKTYLSKLAVVSKETVGPQAGADLRKKATLAVIWSLIGMLVYIGFRFKLEYGVSAIVTLTQDVLMALSVYSFTNREINLPIIAALLTIVGYSINDTVVVFDRVRENLKIMRKDSFESILNRSINQSLGRTIITTGTVFAAVLSLFLFGGKSINDFAFIMLFGSIEGVYSTIYLSCPVVLFWTQLFKPKKGGRR